MIRAALTHVAVHPILMPDQITVAYKCTSTDIALISGTSSVRTNVNRKLTLRGEREGTSVTDQGLLGYMAPTMRCHIAFHSEALLANVACIRTFPRVYPFVSIKTTLLSKPFQTQLTLEGSLACVRPHVYFQIGFATKTRLACCTTVGLIS